jgi:hypothetical protein
LRDPKAAPERWPDHQFPFASFASFCLKILP